MNKVTLTENLDVSAVRALHAQLGSLLTRGAPVVLDGSAVSRIDAAALQLMVAVFTRAAAYGIPVQWQAPSAAVTSAADLLGVSRHIGLNAVTQE